MNCGILTEYNTTTTTKDNNCHTQHSCCTSFGEAAEQPDSHPPPWDYKMAQPLQTTLQTIYVCHMSYNSVTALIDACTPKSLETVKWISDF